MELMARLRRPLLYAAAALAALIVVLAIGLTLIDSNRLKGPLERMASAHLGRQVRISGPLQVELWSRLPRLTITGLSIGNPQWEAERPMATAERVDIQVELSALLRGHVVLHHVELVRPVLYLHQDKSGRANWSLQNQAPSEAPSPQPAHLPVMRDLVIESGKLTLIDELRRLKVEGTVEAQEQGAHADPRPFHVRAEGTINQGPFSLELTGGPLVALSPEQPYPFSLEITAGQNHVQADGRVLKPFDFAGIELDAQASGQDLAQLYYLTRITLPNSPPFRVKARIVRSGNHFSVRDIDGLWGGATSRARSTSTRPPSGRSSRPSCCRGTCCSRILPP
jgi:AsmA family protein